MKGITEIELTDVRTGEKEKYTETNLVTNAIADFFSHNIDGMLFTINGNTNDLNGNMLPLCPKYASSVSERYRRCSFVF